MNYQIALVTLFAVIALITAYDFNDPFFNQLLASEYQELEESLTPFHPRNRRDEEAVQSQEDKCKNHHKKKRLCCADETFESVHEKTKDIKKECFKEVTGREWVSHGHHGHHHHGAFDPFKCDKEKAEKMKNEIMCVAQCVGQKKDVLDEEGNFKESGIKDFVRGYMTNESWFGSIQDKVISTCLSEAKDAADNRDTTNSEACNPAGLKLAHCMFREIQMNCPTEEIKDQKSCDKLKEKLKRKQEMFGGPQ